MRSTRSLSRRLATVEKSLRPTGLMLGTLEVHYTKAWPDCRDVPGFDFQQCTEHGPTCGVSVSPARERGRVLIIMNSPWLGV